MHPPKPSQANSRSTGSAERFRSYIERAVSSELELLAATPQGGRAIAAFKSAAALGRFIGAGYLSLEGVYAQLVSAALATGLPKREAEFHVRRGLKRGAETPGPIPNDAARAGVFFKQPPVPSPSVQSPIALRRPPSSEVLALWENAKSVTEDLQSRQWLESRGIAPKAVEDWDLARGLWDGMPLPRWARTKSGTWLESGHRVLFGQFDARGRMVSCRARCVFADAKPAKSVAPASFRAGGLLLADSMGRQVLKSSDLQWWKSPCIVITEGEPDWLTWASRHPEGDEQGPAFLGIESGGWTQEIADRVPSGTRIIIRTHNDPAGNRYAQLIHQTLNERCHVRRMIPEEVDDVS